MMIIERPDLLATINAFPKWLFIYGRRKTGKTFLVTRFVPHDEYFFVKSNKSVFEKDGAEISLDAFMEILKRGMNEGKTIVIDEFHRLGTSFLDFLHANPGKGKVILISSTLYVSRRMISTHSPLLGLVAEVPVGLITLHDTLRAIVPLPLPKKERLETAIMAREPIVIEYLDQTRNLEPRALLANIVLMSKHTIPALTGEIFSEEERLLSAVYEGIIRAVASGKVGSGAISSELFSKRLIKKDDPSIIQQYLANLIAFGILKRIKVFNKNRFVYKIPSPLSRLFYYADEKYNIMERRIPMQELSTIIEEVMPRIVEDAVREAIAEKLGLQETILEDSDHDVDGCLLAFKKPAVFIEVKWGRVSKEDVAKAERNASRISAPRKILFVRDKHALHTSLEAWDVDDLA